MTEQITRTLNVSKHGTPDYAPQFGIYAEGEQNDLAIVVGEDSKAYAHLFAAAPQLLAACEAAITEIDEGNSMHCDKQLRAAIAAAKGNQ